jgi:hypothetical protein
MQPWPHLALGITPRPHHSRAAALLFDLVISLNLDTPRVLARLGWRIHWHLFETHSLTVLHRRYLCVWVCMRLSSTPAPAIHAPPTTRVLLHHDTPA